MKKTPLFVLAAFVLLLSSCGPGFYFTNPQPEARPNMPGFPARFLGLWNFKKDSISISFSEKYAILYYNFNLNERKSALTGLFRLEGDSIVYSRRDQKFYANIEGDSVHSVIALKDTIFNVDRDGNWLRHYKGIYFMSIIQPEGDYEVIGIRKRFGKITLMSIGAKENRSRLRHTLLDKDGKKFSVNKNDLIRFIRKGGFIERHKLKRSQE